MTSKTYDLDYFIQKAESIPEDEWFVGKFINPDNPKQKCFRGHCDGSFNSAGSNEDEALLKLTDYSPRTFRVAVVNNGDHQRYQQNHPKFRVLQFLKDLKDGSIV